MDWNRNVQNHLTVINIGIDIALNSLSCKISSFLVEEGSYDTSNMLRFLNKASFGVIEPIIMNDLNRQYNFMVAIRLLSNLCVDK